VLTFPLFTGCGSSQSNVPPPPVDDTRAGTVSNPRPANQPQAKKDSTQKVAILAGAAAYYLYNKHKNSQGQGAEGQYYPSKTASTTGMPSIALTG